MSRPPSPFDALPAPLRPEPLQLDRSDDALEVRMHLVLAPGCAWFDGHFPDRPVLPGVAQVHLAAVAALELFGERDAPLACSGTRRLKFHRPILPEQPLTLRLTADALPPSRVRFTLGAGDELASSGTLVFSTSGPGRGPGRGSDRNPLHVASGPYA